MSDNIQEEIEDKVMDCISIGLDGRLVVFKPEENSIGRDIAVGIKSLYKKEEIYFQVNSIVLPAKEETFIKDFPQENFKAKKDFFLLFISFDEVRQKLGDLLWLIPSLQFKDLARVVKLENGKKVFRFESSNQYSRFIVKTQKLGSLILDALENKGVFDFEKSGIEDKVSVNLEDLKEFLYEARENTFAGHGRAIDNPRLLASTQMEFQKGEFTYRDIFFYGDKKVIGQEIIYHNAKPVFGMNYMGDQIIKVELDFLRESLFKLSKKCRMGGIFEYEKREYKYQDKGQGGIEGFSGHEEIFLKGKSIYQLNYQGGLI